MVDRCMKSALAVIAGAAALWGSATAAVPSTPCQQGRDFKARLAGDWTPLLFFDRGSATLTPRALRLLANYIFHACHDAVGEVEVAGMIDTSELALAGGRLGRRRAEAVAALLPILGFTPAHLSVRDYGASVPLVPTGKHSAEAENRRVELYFR